MRNVRDNDVFAGSNFRAMSGPVRTTRTPKGKVAIRGCYPDKGVKWHEFNANTTVTVWRP